MCVNGKYKISAGPDVCQTCPANSNAPAASDEPTDCLCKAGATGADGGPCSLCVAGKYKEVTGDASCTDCLEGEYSTTVGATSDVCQTCPANSNAPAASDEPTDCLCNDGTTGLDGGPCTPICGLSSFDGNWNVNPDSSTCTSGFYISA